MQNAERRMQNYFISLTLHSQGKVKKGINNGKRQSYS